MVSEGLRESVLLLLGDKVITLSEKYRIDRRLSCSSLLLGGESDVSHCGIVERAVWDDGVSIFIMSDLYKDSRSKLGGAIAGEIGPSDVNHRDQGTEIHDE